MNISPQGLELLMAREGKRNAVYLDSVGVPTVGYGHTGPEVHLGDTWTDIQIEEAFAKDLDEFEKAINQNVRVALTQSQFDALVSFAYNVGAGASTRAFESSTMLRYINAGEMGAAALEFNRWHIPPEITSRRNAEREQFKGTQFAARID
jgi:lysozyme